MKPNIRQLKRWIAALDSGEYKQGSNNLHFRSRYCCLGVGCVLFIPDEKLKKENNRILGLVPKHQPNAPEWLALINHDFESKTGDMLSSLNDSGYTFSEIAALLELVYIHKILD